MPEVIFQHEALQDNLVVPHINEVTWAYNLNVQTYPTYAGEVVQILSCYIDNIVVQGDLKTYGKMEDVYRWFLRYMHIATQGQTGLDEDAVGQYKYNEAPVKMTYPHRNWVFYLHPVQLPGFAYGRDIVVPQWQLQAAISSIYQPSRDAEIATMSLDDAVGKLGDDNGFTDLRGRIGYRKENPFSDPNARPDSTFEEKDPADTVGSQFRSIADWYNNLIPSYVHKDFNNIFGNVQEAVSGPIFDGWDDSTSGQSKTKDKTKDKPPT
jgi:hypothetical protein